LVTVVAIIGSQGIPARYGGFEVLAENLAKHLASRHQLIVYCSSNAYKEKKSTFMGAQLEYLPLDANGAQSIFYDFWSMLKADRKADILLILGVSGCIFLPLIKLFSKKTYIVNLDGVDWRRPKWNWLARTFLRVSELAAAKYADILIADNTAIQDYIYTSYKKPSTLVEYGGDNAIIDLPVSNNDNIDVVAVKKSTGGPASELIDVDFDRYAFGVCRIEPENNIHTILEAFAETDAIPLVMVGNWSSSEYGRSLREKFGHLANIQLVNPVWESLPLFALRSNATLYVHGHTVGGTNPSLVEAMCLGLPVFAFDVAFNRATTLNQAHYFCDKDDLIHKLSNLNDAELARLSVKMRHIGEEKYTWKVIAEKYSDLFESANSSSGAGLRSESESVFGNVNDNEGLEEPALRSSYKSTSHSDTEDFFGPAKPSRERFH